MADSKKVDPRLAARRVAVRRAQGRRRLRILIWVMSLAVTLAGAFVLTRSPLLDVDRIVISGVDESAHSLIRNTTELKLGLPMLEVDTAAAQQALTGLAWVRTARVERRWPATLDIEVEPRVAVAIAPANGGYALIDAEGYVIRFETSLREESTYLTLIDAEFEGLPGAVHWRAGPALAVVAALPADLGDWVNAVTLNSAGEVGLSLRGGAAVNLGEPAHLDDKMLAVRTVLSGVDLACLAGLNVALADLTTVTRDPACRPPGLLPVAAATQEQQKPHETPRRPSQKL